MRDQQDGGETVHSLNPRADSDLVLVVGSANMDMVVSCDRFPAPGETIFGGDFGLYPGGKGANQAVACGKLGGNVEFLGKMGNDLFKERLVAGLQKDGVGLEALRTDSARPTGVALITVDATGQNEIVVVSGSNMNLTPGDLDRAVSLFQRAAITLIQLEIPLDTVAYAARLARVSGSLVILNPAPARVLPADLLADVDLLTPNETEAAQLTGIEVSDEASATVAARRLLELGVGNVLLTLGSAGALLVTPGVVRRFSAYRVTAVDTTAAGDAFNGGLAYALARRYAVDRAVEFASAVAALSVTRRGAQASMPTLEETLRFLQSPSTVAAGTGVHGPGPASGELHGDRS